MAAQWRKQRSVTQGALQSINHVQCTPYHLHVVHTLADSLPARHQPQHKRWRLRLPCRSDQSGSRGRGSQRSSPGCSTAAGYSAWGGWGWEAGAVGTHFARQTPERRIRKGRECPSIWHALPSQRGAPCHDHQNQPWRPHVHNAAQVGADGAVGVLLLVFIAVDSHLRVLWTTMRDGSRWGCWGEFITWASTAWLVLPPLLAGRLLLVSGSMGCLQCVPGGLRWVPSEAAGRAAHTLCTPLCTMVPLSASIPCLGTGSGSTRSANEAVVMAPSSATWAGAACGSRSLIWWWSLFGNAACGGATGRWPLGPSPGITVSLTSSRDLKGGAREGS